MTASLRWIPNPFRQLNGVPPLQQHKIYGGDQRPGRRLEQPKKLWIIVHDIRRKSFKTFKAMISKKLSRDDNASQILVLSFRASLLEKADATLQERELLAERLIRGLSRAISEQGPCWVVLLGCADAAWTLELALCGGSLESNSIPEPVMTILSKTVGIVSVRMPSETGDFKRISTNLDAILEGRAFTHIPPRPLRLRMDRISETGLQNRSSTLMGWEDVVFREVKEAFMRGEMLQAYPGAKNHLAVNASTDFGKKKRAATDPREPTVASSTELKGLTRSLSLPEKSNQRMAPLSMTVLEPGFTKTTQVTSNIEKLPSTPSSSAEQPQETSNVEKLPSAPSSSLPSMPVAQCADFDQFTEQAKGLMEEERVAGAYLDEWDLPSAKIWYEKCQEKLAKNTSHPRYESIQISIAVTLICMGEFTEAAKILDAIANSNQKSTVARWRSQCYASCEGYEQAAKRLGDINDSYAPTERISSPLMLNATALASLNLAMGKYKEAEKRAKFASEELELLWKMHTSEYRHVSSLKESASQNKDGSNQSPGLPRKTPEDETTRLNDQIETINKNMLDSKSCLIKTWTELGHIVGAFQLSKETLDGMKSTWGPKHVITLRSANSHARILLLREDFGEAEVTCKNALRSIADQLGSEHYITLGFVGTLVKIYLSQGRWRDAHEMAESLVARNRTAIGEDHPQTIESEIDFAHACNLLGRIAAAEELQEGVQDRSRRVLGHRHPMTLLNEGRLASLYYDGGRWEEACNQIWEVHEYLKQTEQEQSICRSMAAWTIGSVARKLARQYKIGSESRKLIQVSTTPDGFSEQLFAISIRHLDSVIQYYGSTVGTDHGDFLWTKFERLLITRDQNREESDKLAYQLRETLDALRSKRSRSRLDIAAMEHELSLTYADMKQWNDALKHEKSSHVVRFQHLGKAHPDVLWSKIQLASILWHLGEKSDAEEFLNDAQDALCNDRERPPAFDIISVNSRLANLFDNIGRYEKSRQLQEGIVSQLEKIRQMEHEEVDQSEESLRLQPNNSGWLESRYGLVHTNTRLRKVEEAQHQYEIENELGNRYSMLLKADPFYFFTKSYRPPLEPRSPHPRQVGKLHPKFHSGDDSV